MLWISIDAKFITVTFPTHNIYLTCQLEFIIILLTSPRCIAPSGMEVAMPNNLHACSMYVCVSWTIRNMLLLNLHSAGVHVHMQCSLCSPMHACKPGWFIPWGLYSQPFCSFALREGLAWWFSESPLCTNNIYMLTLQELFHGGKCSYQ